MVIGELAVCWKRFRRSGDGVLRLRVYLLPLYKASSFAAANEIFFSRFFRRVVILVVTIGERSIIGAAEQRIGNPSVCACGTPSNDDVLVLFQPCIVQPQSRFNRAMQCDVLLRKA